MAQRRYEPSPDDRWGRERDRPLTDRAADEVRSWFGDEDATSRRARDEHEHRWRERDRGQSPSARERSSEPDRWNEREAADWRDRNRHQDTFDEGRTWHADEEAARRRASHERGDAWRDRPYYSEAGAPYPSRADWTAREQHQEPRYGRYRDRDEPAWRSAAPAHGYGREERWSERDRPDYSGRGPRGYRRSDQRILEDVCDRLTDDPHVDASDIEVRIVDGEVNLLGNVRSRDEKRRAEDLAESAPGVRDVKNELRVNPGVIGTPGAPQTPLGLSGPGGDARSVSKPGSAESVSGEPTRRR